MRKSKRKISKLGLLFIILLFSLSCISISYSGWTDDIAITGTVTTGDDIDYFCLEGYWSFDEGSGNIAHDSSFNNHDGIIIDAIWTTGKIGNALLFDGDSDYVDIGTGLSLTNNFTVCAWVNASSIGADRQVISKGYNGVDTQWELKTATSDGKIDFRKWTSSGAVGVRSTKVLPVNTWVHLAGTYDGTNWKIYLNGTLDNYQVGTGPIETAQSLYIGAVDHGEWGIPAQFWHGQIDEVKVYSCVLTADELLLEYQEGII